MKRSRRNSAFVLVMVLVVLAVMGVVLGSAARRSCQSVLDAGAAQEELQVHWGSLSCQALCLPMAERILSEPDPQLAVDSMSARRTVVLGGITFDLLVSDEDAKANINLLASRVGDDILEAVVRELQEGQRVPLHIELRPSEPPPEAVSVFPLKFLTYDQVFRFAGPDVLYDPESRLPAATGRITCWGSGRASLKRADRQVLRSVLRGLATEGQIARLADYRDERPDCTVAEAVGQLDLNREQARAVLGSLSDASTCYSLWVVAQGAARRWYCLAISQAGDEAADARRVSFSW